MIGSIDDKRLIAIVTGSNLLVGLGNYYDTQTIAGWEITHEKFNKGYVELNASTQVIKLGSASSMSGNGIYLSGSGDFNIQSGTNEFIRKSGSTLQIKSTNVELSSSTVKINTPEFYFGSVNNFISGSGGNLSIKSDTFNLSSSNVQISSSVFNLKDTLKWTGSELTISGSSATILTSKFYLGSSTSYISGSTSGLKIVTGDAKISGSSVEINTEKFFVGSSTSYLSASGGNVKISGSNVSVLTPSFYFGSASNYISGSDGSLLIKTNTFNLSSSGVLLSGSTLNLGDKFVWDGADLTVSGSIYATSGYFSGELQATAGKIGGFKIDTTEISSSGLIMKSTGQITGSNVLFTGGNIGGWDISTESLYKGGTYLSSSDNGGGLIVQDTNNISRVTIGAFNTASTNLTNVTDNVGQGISSTALSFIGSIPHSLVASVGTTYGSATLTSSISTSLLAYENITYTIDMYYPSLALNEAINGFLYSWNVKLTASLWNNEVEILETRQYGYIDYYQWYGAKQRLTYSYVNGGTELNGLKLVLSASLTRADSMPAQIYIIDGITFDTSIDTSQISITPTKALFYTNKNNYFEWTPQQVKIKTNEFSTNELLVEGGTQINGNTIMSGSLIVLGQMVVSGSLSSHPIIPNVPNDTSLSTSTVLSSINFDVWGHVNGITTRTLAVGDIGAVPTSRNVSTNNGLTGGGNLTADITIGLTGQAKSFHDLTTNGLVVRSASVALGRTITGTTNRISISNGDGLSGNPTVDISTSYVGQTSITTLGTIGSGTWNATTIGVNRGGTGRTSHTTNALLTGGTTTTGAQQSLENGTSGDWLKSNGTSLPSWVSPASLTKTDDTNVTLTLGGSPTTALLNGASLSLGWSGQLAVARGGTGQSTLDDILGTTNQIDVLNGTDTVIGGNVTLSLPQDIHTGATPTFSALTITNNSTLNNVTISGNLTILGGTFSASVETVLIQDNLITLNDGETGAGVTAGFSGVEIDRGTADSFWFVFDETKDKFVTGMSGSMQVVATREDSPITNAIPFFNDSENRFDTDSNFKWNSTSGLAINKPITIINTIAQSIIDCSTTSGGNQFSGSLDLVKFAKRIAATGSIIRGVVSDINIDTSQHNASSTGFYSRTRAIGSNSYMTSSIAYDGIVQKGAGGTLNTGIVFNGLAYQESSVYNTAYIFKGDFSGTITNKYGVFIENESLNYLSSILHVGTQLSSSLLSIDNLNLDGNTISSISGKLILNPLSGQILEISGSSSQLGNQSVNGTISGTSTITGTQLISNIAIGTSPLLVTSNTLVNNLNADLWDGNEFATYLNQAVLTTSSPTFAGLTIDNLNLDGNTISSTTGHININPSGSQNVLISAPTNITTTSFSNDTIFSIDGTSGRLFSIVDTLDGVIFSANTISGLPTIEAYSDYTVNIGNPNNWSIIATGSGDTYLGTKNVFISSSGFTSINQQLDVSGAVRFASGLTVTGSTVFKSEITDTYTTQTALHSFIQDTVDRPIRIGLSETGYGLAQIEAMRETSTQGRGYLALKTRRNGLDDTMNEHFRITSDGKIGIGTTTPANKLDVNGSVRVSTNLIIKDSLINNQSNLDVDSSAVRDIASVVNTYSAVFFDYVVKNGINQRVGTVMCSYNGSNVEYTDFSTVDQGDTSGVILSCNMEDNLIKLQANVSTNNWIIKTIVRAI